MPPPLSFRGEVVPSLAAHLKTESTAIGEPDMEWLPQIELEPGGSPIGGISRIIEENETGSRTMLPFTIHVAIAWLSSGNPIEREREAGNWGNWLSSIAMSKLRRKGVGVTVEQNTAVLLEGVKFLREEFPTYETNQDGLCTCRIEQVYLWRGFEEVAGGIEDTYFGM
ncbi:MAG: hypothetical protein J7647_32160 [Cyanobacteria bacterium SBLK]|nr:hypothetical protein [Cyanobacteria bacterium SBLK]